MNYKVGVDKMIDLVKEILKKNCEKGYKKKCGNPCAMECGNKCEVKYIPNSKYPELVIKYPGKKKNRRL